ncbi:unnamed protein product [Boreogadus saida]
MGKGDKQKETPSLENQVFGITVKNRREDGRNTDINTPYFLIRYRTIEQKIAMMPKGPSGPQRTQYAPKGPPPASSPRRFPPSPQTKPGGH